MAWLWHWCLAVFGSIKGVDVGFSSFDEAKLLSKTTYLKLNYLSIRQSGLTKRVSIINEDYVRMRYVE